MNNDIETARNLYIQGNFAEADKKLREILTKNPHIPEAWHYLGLIAYRIKNYKASIKFLDIAISIFPHEKFYLDKGNVLGEIQDFSGAIECYEKVKELNPASKSIYNNLGVVYEKKGDIEKALENYKKALEITPNSPLIYTNIGVMLNKNGYNKEAIESYLKAIELDPNLATAHYNLGIAYNNEPDKAILHYKKTLELNPDYKKAYLNLAISYLIKKDFDNGWKYYEERFQVLNRFKPQVSNPKPKWDGSSLKDKIIYVYYEQGFGDTIQFCRFIPYLKKLEPKKILFKPQPGLETLLRQNYPDIEIVDNSVSDENIVFDTYVSLLSLLYYFKINTENIPDNYIKPDPNKVIEYKEKYCNNDKFKIGICWQGSPDHKRDKERSIPLEYFRALFEFQNVQVYSLQHGHECRQIDNFDTKLNLINLGKTFYDFSDTAAAIENLDLVISVDTSISHLSGAMGKPTWIILPMTNDLRWFLDEDTTPWYKSIRLFRPKPNEKRILVMDRIIDALQSIVNA